MRRWVRCHSEKRLRVTRAAAQLEVSLITLASVGIGPAARNSQRHSYGDVYLKFGLRNRICCHMIPTGKVLQDED